MLQKCYLIRTDKHLIRFNTNKVHVGQNFYRVRSDKTGFNDFKITV